MRRTLLAVLFFVALVAIWAAIVRAKIWSPILLPSPRSVGEYLISAIRDGTLWQATAVTLRRLLLGYFIGLVIGLPLGLLTASSKFVEDTIGVLALGLQTLPSVCWVPLALLWFGQTEGAMLFVVIMGTVWSVVIATDTGVRTIPPIYRAGSADDGLRSVSQMDARPFAGLASISGQRNETGLGVCVAFINGRGDLCNDSDRIRPGPFASLWSRIKRDGPGDRDHARDCRDRFVGRQNIVLALGTFSPSPLGNGPSVGC